MEEFQKAWNERYKISEDTFKKIDEIARLMENNNFLLIIVSYANSAQQEYIMNQLQEHKTILQEIDITKQNYVSSALLKDCKEAKYIISTDSKNENGPVITQIVTQKLLMALKPRFYFSYDSKAYFSKDFFTFQNF